MKTGDEYIVVFGSRDDVSRDVKHARFNPHAAYSWGADKDKAFWGIADAWDCRIFCKTGQLCAEQVAFDGGFDEREAWRFPDDFVGTQDGPGARPPDAHLARVDGVDDGRIECKTFHQASKTTRLSAGNDESSTWRQVVWIFDVNRLDSALAQVGAMFAEPALEGQHTYGFLHARSLFWRVGRPR